MMFGRFGGSDADEAAVNVANKNDIEKKRKRAVIPEEANVQRSTRLRKLRRGGRSTFNSVVTLTQDIKPLLSQFAAAG
jgi:hypothetical protein